MYLVVFIIISAISNIHHKPKELLYWFNCCSWIFYFFKCPDFLKHFTNLQILKGTESQVNGGHRLLCWGQRIQPDSGKMR